MIDYKFQGRLQYLPGGSLDVQMSAWPVIDTGSPGTTNLLAWWTLNETSGTREDSHSGNHDMSVRNTPSYTTGKVGNAGTVAVTNGAGDYFAYADTGDALDCPSGSSITVCCWAYFDSLPSNNGYPVSRWESSGDWSMNVNSSGALLTQAAYFGGVTTAQTANGSVASGGWYFLTLVYDHSVGTNGTVYASVNAGTRTSEALVNVKTAESGVSVTLGALRRVSENYGNMAGAIDEVCIYQRALTDDELTWLYNGGNGRTYADL